MVIIVLVFAITALPSLLYAIWYMRKHFGPEWYRIKVDIPPEVRKSPRVRVFKYAGLIVLIIGLALGSWFKDPMLALFFIATSYIIMYQGAKEETKYFPPQQDGHAKSATKNPNPMARTPNRIRKLAPLKSSVEILASKI